MLTTTILKILGALVSTIGPLLFMYLKGRKDVESNNVKETLKKQQDIDSVKSATDDDVIKRLRNHEF